MFSHNSKDGLGSLDTKHIDELRDSQVEDPSKFQDKNLGSRTSIRTSGQPGPKRSGLGSLLGGANPAPSHSEVLPSRQDEAMVMGNYTIYWINRKDNDKMYQLLIKLPSLAKVQEAIRDVIPYMNQRLAEENSNYMLSFDQNLFDFFKAKKTGKPNYDYPSLDVTESLSTTGIQRLTLEEKTPDAVVLRNDKTRMTMVKSTMLGEGSMVEDLPLEEPVKYVTKMVCCCIPVKVEVSKTKGKSVGKGDLQQVLVEN